MNRESERKRLVELIKSTPHGTKTLGDVLDSLYIENVMVKHLLDNGIVVPPVKVGQTVYYVCGIHNKLVEEAKIEEIYYNGESYMYLVNSNYLHFEMTPDELYFTKEDAVKALKGEEE